MRKRKVVFIAALIACLLAVIASAFISWMLAVAVFLAAVPVVYIAYKPMIPTPAPIWYLYNNHIKPRIVKDKAPAPKPNLGGYREPKPEEFEADFYISTEGNDDNDGSENAPFATFDRAKRAVRELDKAGKKAVTVAVRAGEYSVSEITFGPEDCGTADCEIIYKAHGGEVTLNGGVTISPDAFCKVSDSEILRRLSDGAKKNIYVADLAALGLARAEIGNIHAFGAYHTADKYDGDWAGPLHCELFVNDRRQTLARYPNGDQFLLTEKPVFTVGGSETEGTGTFAPEWRSLRNPPSDILSVDEALAERIAFWQSLDDVWMFGYWMYDWADASTPIGSFDREKRALSPKFVSKWGIKEGAPYYFFNVLEELDTPGEWYLDRKGMKLYLYPDGDISTADIFLTVTQKNIIKVSGAEHITFDGFTLKGTRSDAVDVTGNHITVQNCAVKNVAGTAILMNGSHNIARNNHITHTGQGGIYLDGGDRETLTPGNCVAENNLIHSWSEIYKTYCPAVQLKGVGNICRYNEMYDSPHEVVWYHGNDHVIEYNHIHDACKLTKDGGAIYAGKNWSYYGSVVRYNCIHDLGSKEFTACGIYMDDAVSGQTIHDNLLVNIPGMAIQLGGGRDLTVNDNVIVNCTTTPILYDARAREGALFGGWFHYCSEPDGLMWRWLWESPYKNETWQAHYPQIAAFCEDFNTPDNLYFVPNPGCSEVTGNIIVDGGPFHGNILCREAKRFGTVKNNRFYSMKKLQKLFVAPEKGNYTLRKERGE